MPATATQFPQLNLGDDFVPEEQSMSDEEEEEVIFEKTVEQEHDSFTSNKLADTTAKTLLSSELMPPETESEPHEEATPNEDTILHQRAIWAMLFCVFTDSVNFLCITSNIPLMVTPEAHHDSFSDTEPLDAAAAQYMIVSAASAGAFIANIASGWISGYIGQRRTVLINLFGSIVFILAKYGSRHNYWIFTAMAFANGCFSSTPAVGLGYMAEAFLNDRVKADVYMGYVVAFGVVGRAAGGLLAVLTPRDIFFPLLSATMVTACGLIIAYCFLLDPRNLPDGQDQVESATADDQELGSKEKTSANLPEEIDTCALFNVLCGSVIDYAGLIGIFSLAYYPLTFDTFHYDFVEDGLDPIMSEQTYRIVFATSAISIVVGAILAPWLFKNIGVAVACVLANLIPAAFTISLLYIALIEPVTKTTFVLYTAVLYIGYALSVVSQISTGPMLDRVTPLKKKGLVQGINGAICDGSFAVFPFLYALIVDYFGIAVALWTSTGVCCLAALVNLPLVFHPRMQKKLQVEDRLVSTELAAAASSRLLLSSSHGSSRVLLVHK